MHTLMSLWRARRALWISVCALALADVAAPVHAQFKLEQTFRDSTATGWTTSGSAYLTAPSVDAVGDGWLRLTNAINAEQGQGLSTASFSSNTAVVLKFSFVSWGGTGADGLSVFLFDSTQNMSGAQVGGGLGYCGGAGGYLAIGLDEFGNFANPGDTCGALSGGPGPEPESLGIRGPLSDHNHYITGASVSGGIDNPYVATRPSSKAVILTLTPATVGYTISAQFQSAQGQPFQTLFSNVSFPYTPPANLSVGFGASTGGSNNYHELRDLVVATPDDIDVTMTGPSSILQGTTASYTVTVTNNGAYAIDTANAPTVTDTLPAGITNVSWTCVASSGATCAGSGSGNLNTTNLSIPANGHVTYTVTGTLDPTASCGSTITGSANADFGTSSGFSDPNESDNTASTSATVTCTVTILANPTSLSFGMETVGTPTAAQTVTLTGTNGATISAVSVTGDYSQTNNCSAALTTSTSCTINVVFTPSAEGSSNGTLTIVSTAASSPTTVALTGTGTNSVPNAFTFTPANGVDPSSVQVSNAITVSGTNIPSMVSISDGAQYSVNGGAYTSTAETVPPGAQITVKLTASSNYSTAVSATLTIGGVQATFTVTTHAVPILPKVTVTSGGGATAPFMLLALSLILLYRVFRGRKVIALAVVAFVIALSGPAGRPLMAADLFNDTYVGVRAGQATSTLTQSKLTGTLESEGYDVEASSLNRRSVSASVYGGYEIGAGFAAELAWSYLGRTSVSLQGIEPANLNQLLQDTAHVTRGSGDVLALEARYRWTIVPQVALDLRAGPYLWNTHTKVWVASSEELSRTDRGCGYTVGIGPRYSLGRGFGLGVNADYFVSTSDNRFVQVAVSLDYRFH